MLLHQFYIADSHTSVMEVSGCFIYETCCKNLIKVQYFLYDVVI